MHKFTKLQEEHLINTYRQSKLFLVKGLVFTFTIILVPAYFLWQYDLLNQYGTYVFVLSVIAALWFIREAIIWYRNCYVLTNYRLILFSHEGLFKRTVIETPLERILNVSYKTTGLISAMFDFGDVEVQVVGLVEPIILLHIASPAEIKDYLWDLHKRIVAKPIAYDAGNLDHFQEQIGYTKKNQKIL